MKNKEKECLPNEVNQVGQSSSSSSHNSFGNTGINSLFSFGTSKNSGISINEKSSKQECKLKDPVNFNPIRTNFKDDPGFIPFNKKSQNHEQVKPTWGFLPASDIPDKPWPLKTFNELSTESKGKENVLPSITISPPSSGFMYDHQVTVLPKPKICVDISDLDHKKVTTENNIDVNKIKNIQSDNDKVSSNTSNHKDKKGDIIVDSTPVVQNEQFKIPNGDAEPPPIVIEPPVKSVSLQSVNQEKLIMAPPSTNIPIKPNRGINKSSCKSGLLRTQSNNRPNPGLAATSDVPSFHETLFVNNKQYFVLSTLGKGGSSEVYMVLEPKQSKLLAVKCVNLKTVDKIIADGYLNEVELLLKLQGCNSVINMFDHEYIEDQKLLYVVMEKGDTDLSRLLHDIQKTKKISMAMIIYYWTEMLNAVKDIHERGIIHSDLKPANFLLVCGRLKLIDFGIASSLQGDMTSVLKEVTCGTWNYMSPEAINNIGNSARGCKISYKSDVWSLGCILYNLIYKKTPFSHITSVFVKLTAIVSESHVIEFPKQMESGEHVPPFILETLKKCLIRDPKQRPSVKELLDIQRYDVSNNIDKDNIEDLLKPVKEHITEKLKNILLPEDWEKISHVIEGLDNINFRK